MRTKKKNIARVKSISITPIEDLGPKWNSRDLMSIMLNIRDTECDENHSSCSTNSTRASASLKGCKCLIVDFLDMIPRFINLALMLPSVRRRQRHIYNTERTL